MDDEIAFESDDGEFILHRDGSWEALQDGKTVHGSAFTTHDMHTIEEVMWPLNQSRLNMHANDRYGEQ